MHYFCCDERRRNLVKDHDSLNGIDYLEVKDNKNDPNEQRQRTLSVHFLKNIAPGELTEENVLIEGGERIRNIKVVRVSVGGIESPPSASPPESDLSVLVVEVSTPGDFSMYTLRIVRDAEDEAPPEGFDPILSAIDFSFKVACQSDFDCKPSHVCPAESLSEPEINYLAKDFASFKQLILDRMAVVMPRWKERNPADLGISLVELLAYVADHLSYQQDAVATEAYLGTARRRISVRRHARLVDYVMHEGSNARVWIQIGVKEGVTGLVLKREHTFIENGEKKKTKTQFLTKTNIPGHIIRFSSKAYEEALVARPVVFELMHDTTLYSEHNEIQFYTWGDQRCCLPKGATRATLLGRNNNLKAGDILIVSEKLGPETGREEDADPARRHAVRLTAVHYQEDPLGKEYAESPPVSSPSLNNPVPVTEIRWHSEDALLFSFCISATTDAGYRENVSVALGNIVLADHGQTIEDEEIGTVPKKDNPVLTKVEDSENGYCNRKPAKPTPPRFRPKLKERPLTHAAYYKPVSLEEIESPPLTSPPESNANFSEKPPVSAKAAMEWPGKKILPSVIIFSDPFDDKKDKWEPRRDLIISGPSEQVFVPETESDGTTLIRFGDDTYGKRPNFNTSFKATYRVGNGIRGNVGAETIAHIVSKDPHIITEVHDPFIIEVKNPLPAKGGTEPETMEQARQNAPYAFRTQKRAVTTEDYEEIAKRCDEDIQRAKARFRWTGSWHTVYITADRLGGEMVNENFERELRTCLERYRMMGHDLEVDNPHFVSLEIEISVCVKPGYFASDIETALLEILSNRTLPNGGKGVFHPDNFTFGQTVYLSPIYAVVQSIQGVSSSKITKFQRQGIDSNEWLDAGKIVMEGFEIARLDNDPNNPERGVLRVETKGGR
ncbi:MAG: putative baseplate assembly protein [Candidatus Scalindua sp. AMX11]|nr:MAG: putative baseplate assembly protein [Candidatus Scalindua sp.]NOG84212.1 putative baseplate assembly protein [Planctomycetota bacterium]RZV64244.1 MAG: putative baseplate assembly protein [Candidatus Scalindua sp. SCAELEC01]TDE63418.1 MAG: putative baseplate assembly protein [Candidatus Scalindua sp. AMX11]GJQ57326.1 MAG: putative baseplate assembly protein [Candidatus Scalindua sp.]